MRSNIGVVVFLLLVSLLSCREDISEMFVSCENDYGCKITEKCVSGICRQNCIVDIDCGSAAYCFQQSCYYYGAEQEQNVQCLTYKDCQPYNVCVDGTCRNGCLEDKHCGDDLFCVITSDSNLGECKECRNDDQCKIHHICRENTCIFKCFIDDHCSGSPYGYACEKTSGKCVECTSSQHCGENQKCEDNICVTLDSKCKASDDCSVEFPICQVSTGKCVECLNNTDCSNGEYCIDHECHFACKYRNDCFDEQYCYTNGEGYGKCVDCYEDTQCPLNYECFAFTCYNKSCESDSDCYARGFCHPTLKLCYAIPDGGCLDNWDCPQVTVVCDPYTHMKCLKQCYSNASCYEDTPYCNTSQRFPACYECLEDIHCDTRCSRYDKTCLPCSEVEPCRGEKSFCDIDSGVCHYCLEDSDCENSYYCIEGDDGLQCVECISDYDCKTEEKPDCGKNNTCIAKCQDECQQDEISCITDSLGNITPYFKSCVDSDNDYCMEWSSSYTQCSNGRKCTDGVCKCVDECEPDSRFCDAEDERLVRMCIKSGYCYESTTQHCSSDQICKDGECVTILDGDSDMDIEINNESNEIDIVEIEFESELINESE